MTTKGNQMSFVRDLRRILLPGAYVDAEQERLADVLLVTILAGLSGLLLVLINRLVRSDFDQFPSIVSMCAALVVAMLLLRGGQLRWAKSVALWGMLVFVTYQCVKDDGIHDLSVFAYPAILAMAGMLLGRVHFVLFTAVILISFVTVGYLEMEGVLQSKFSAQTDPVVIVDIVVILSVTAIAVRLLASALVRSVNQARDHQIAITNQNEELRRSEERYRVLFEAANDAIFIMQEDRFIECNSMTLSMYGCRDRSEIIGHTPWEFSPPRQPDGRESKEKAMEVIHAALAGRPQRFSWTHTRRDGTFFDAEVSLSALTSGSEVLIQALVRDVTEQRKAELALRESEERFRTLFECQGEGTGIVDEREQFVLCNPAAESIFGVSAGGLAGRNLKEFVSPEQWRLLQSQSKMRREGTRSTYEMEITRFDGETRLLVVTATPWYRDGHYVGAFGVFRDITEQHRLQQHLVQAQRIQSLGTLAGGVAHDFNNILSIILGYVSELERGRADSTRFSDAVKTITSAVGRGAALVQQILTFARKTEVQFAPVVLPDLIRELLSMLERTFPKSISFRREFGKDIPALAADHTQIHQAILNLCVNARDAMPGGGEIAIGLSALSPEEVAARFAEAEDYRYVCIQVSDTGMGMDDDTKRRVFDPFFTTKETGKGTGLGLSVVYGIVQSHRGFIEVDSAVGKGTTFRIYLPARLEKSMNPSREQDGQDIQGGNETILLVEDEEPLRTLMRDRLSAKGYRVLEAQNGREAIECFDGHRREIALVFSDLEMPEVDGASLLRKVREISPNTPFIITGGFLIPETKNDLTKDGAEVFFQKPYDPADALSAIRSILNRNPSS